MLAIPNFSNDIRLRNWVDDYIYIYIYISLPPSLPPFVFFCLIKIRIESLRVSWLIDFHSKRLEGKVNSNLRPVIQWKKSKEGL
jgi:hypothetical protein